MKSDEIGERIKELRRCLGLSLNKFGSYIGTIASSVHSWESGRTNPKRCTVLKIAKVFDVNLEWLDTGVGPMFATGAEDSIPKPPENSSTGAASLTVDVVTRIFNALTDDEQATVVDAITAALERKATAARKRLDRLTDGQG